MSEQIEHITRTPLPWRKSEHLTECGLEASKYPSLTPDEAIAKVKKQGQQRAAMSTCMTCWSRGGRGFTRGETEDLVQVLQRECERVRWEDGGLLRAELRAIVDVVEAHRDECVAHIEAQSQMTDIAVMRAKRRRLQA